MKNYADLVMFMVTYHKQLLFVTMFTLSLLGDVPPGGASGGSK
jgi:hypothetical protein